MSLNDIELVKWMKLGRIKGLGPRKIQALVDYFGNLEKIFNASNDELLDTRVFKERMIPEWEKLKGASDQNFLKAIHEAMSQDIQIVTLIDSRYPAKLKSMPSPPLTLFLRGDISLLEKKGKIAIVGTRQPSGEAKKLALEFSTYFSNLGLVIISGGAEGIDTIAHEGALASEIGKTICVFGTGLFHAFPPKNAPLFERIVNANGLLISEHLPNFSGSRFSFIQRNRMTSGLSDGLFVCASGETGGSMVQTKTAWEQRIPIFCPAIDMDIQPNEGMKVAIKSYGAHEIREPLEMLKMIKKPKSLDSYLIEPK